MKHLLKIALLAIGIVLLCPAAECHAGPPQYDSLVLQVSFRQSNNLLLRGYRNNDLAIDKLLALQDDNSIERITLVSITGSASPIGNEKHNEFLALERAKAVRTYIYWKLPALNRDLVHVEADTNFCAAWIRAVERDTLIPRRNEVLEILHSDASIATKWTNIQQLPDNPARYFLRTTFPYMRNAVSCVVRLKLPEEQVSAPVTPLATIADTLALTTTSLSTITDSVQTPNIGIDLSHLAKKDRKPLFALKSNLLFDAATMLNLELEVPISQHWSVAGEVIVPWWLWKNEQHCIQMMSGNIEGKYWFGNRQNRPQMTGWFAGLYAGGGYYDLEWDRTGYQGEFFIALGVSGGYAHTINRRGNLRMEYTLGIGYMQTSYRKYEAKIGSDDAWHLYRREAGTYKWFGPTRLKVSLAWMLDFKGKGGAK